MRTSALQTLGAAIESRQYAPVLRTPEILIDPTASAGDYSDVNSRFTRYKYRFIGKQRFPMHRIKLTERLFNEAQRRAAAAGFENVDEFIADRLESDFANDQENLDDRFTPEVIARLDQISLEMNAGKSVSMEQAERQLSKVR
jgi:hypothetical protein